MTRNSKLKTMSSPTNISDGVSQSSLPAFGLVENHLNQVKKLIDEQMTGPVEAGDINKLLRYVRCRNGEMIRPALLLLAGKYCGKITEEHIRVAAIIEIIHNATLLHGDIIDRRQERFDESSFNNLCSNENSVLLGDFLLGRAFQMCAEMIPHVNEVISAAAVRICEGQLRQIAQRRNWRLSESEYIEVITEKSAVLFSTACRLGALLAHGSDEEIKLLARYGLNVGISYQINDDLLDVIKGQNWPEKTTVDNLGTNGLSLAVIHLLSVVDEKTKKIVINLFSRRNGTQKDKDVLLGMLKSHGSLEYARSRAQDFVKESIDSLNSLAQSEARDALVKTTNSIGSRAI
jgi:octaprenyl-diphosphate synthase